jgi:hypothetical protein
MQFKKMRIGYFFDVFRGLFWFLGVYYTLK